jgi:signal peptidase I
VACRTIHRFDIVVIAHSATGKRLAKRVIGLPGDRIRLENSWKVYIDGRPLDYSINAADNTITEAGNHLITKDSSSPSSVDTRFGKQDLLLGPDEYFLLGDNRLASNDSRQFGPVMRREIEGKLSLVWYSYDQQARALRPGRVLQMPR